jgi:hypothetical protein
MTTLLRCAVAFIVLGCEGAVASAGAVLPVSGDARSSWRGAESRLAWRVTQRGERLRSGSAAPALTSKCHI